MKIVLAYSGGLDTTVSIRWLKETFNADVITVTVDVGQKDDFNEIEKRAYIAGSTKHYTIDAKEEFVNDYIAPAIKMNGLYEDVYPLSTALARPLIAKKVVEIAKLEKAEYIAHGSTSKGNDQIRFDLTIRALLPDLKIIAPARIWKMTREDEIKYAKEKGILIKEENKKYSIDENLWGRSIEGDNIADPYVTVPDDAFEWTKKIKDGKLLLSIQFERGLPIAINEERMNLLQLINFLNKIVGNYGYGRVEHIENRVVGFKSREVYEAPAALTIIHAHKDLEKTIYTPYELRFKKYIDQIWADLVYQGLWFEPLREIIQATGDYMNKWIEGEVKLQIENNGLTILGRKSKFSSYSEKLASYNKGWYPTDEMARGFIEIFGMHSLTARRMRYE
jgi:argininosuccinate synthase